MYFFFFLLIEKLNHVGKSLYLSSQNTVDCYKLFFSVSKYSITNTTFFFPSLNIGSIIPLVSITYLPLIHNYNTIKYICFISSRQRAGMSSSLQQITSNIQCFPTRINFSFNFSVKVDFTYKKIGTCTITSPHVILLTTTLQQPIKGPRRKHYLFYKKNPFIFWARQNCTVID